MRPVATALPSMSVPKRAPSSSLKKATTSGRRVVTPRVVQGAHHLERAQHAQAAVEAPRGGHRVDVRAGHHRRRAVVAARAAPEDVADAVDGDVEARGLHHVHHVAAALAVVLR